LNLENNLSGKNRNDAHITVKPRDKLLISWTNNQRARSWCNLPSAEKGKRKFTKKNRERHAHQTWSVRILSTQFKSRNNQPPLHRCQRCHVRWDDARDLREGPQQSSRCAITHLPAHAPWRSDFPHPDNTSTQDALGHVWRGEWLFCQWKGTR